MGEVSEGLKQEFTKAHKALMDANSVCIISHLNPDGDAVGSNLALRHALEAQGKKVTSACVDPLPPNCQWLKAADKFVQDFEYQEHDVIVSVDCGALKLVAFHESKPEILSGKKPFINFDHHGSNDNFGTINPVEPDACATSFIMYQFFRMFRWKITVDMATALMHGIYFDTGGLMHSNTCSMVYKMSGDLQMKGANLQKIAKELFHTTPVNKMRLWGRILERMYVNDENVVVSAVNQNDYKACGANSKDTSGAIDYLNSVPGSEYCVLLSEGENGLVKGSLRTRKDDLNLSEVASKWGGGGHPKASGFGMNGKLKPKMTWTIETENGEEGGSEKHDF